MTHQAEGSQRTADDADLEFAYEVNAWKSRLINQAASLTGMFETNARLREQLAAMKASSNYVCDKEVCPTSVTFADGRIVRLAHDANHGYYLEIERAS
jgi:hypothetical protein